MMRCVDILVCLSTFPSPDLSVWRQISQTVAKPEGTVKIAIVGKI